MFSQEFSIIIIRFISVPVHYRELEDVFNSIEKPFLFQLMSTVQLLGDTFMKSR